MKKAIYTGSFDPVTLGHMDIIRRAADTFDELVVGVLNNKEKKPLFSVEERVKILQEAVRDIPNVKIDSFSGLFVDYAREKDIWIAVRGLRAITDLEYEMQMAQTNRMLSGGKLDTVFLLPIWTIPISVLPVSSRLPALAGIFPSVCRIS